MAYFKCKICGNFADEGDPLYFICLNCIDDIHDGKFDKSVLSCGHIGFPVDDDNKIKDECIDCWHFHRCVDVFCLRKHQGN